MKKRKAEYWEKVEDGKIKCNLCPHGCVIGQGEEGLCWARKNENGVLYAQNYGRTTSLAVDPIEKKPLYHFYPGTRILSVAPNGCNMRCPYCQNYSISARKTATRKVGPDELANLAENYGVQSIAFTYTEPLIWFEYIMDTAEFAKQKDIKLVLVTNGLISEEPLNDILEVVDAMNVDLKSMDPEYYRKTLKGNLEATKRTIERGILKAHVEVTNLLIPEDNDDEIEKLAGYLSELDQNIPLHISRYFPYNNYSRPRTPVETLREAYKISQKYLNYVFVGNVSIPDTENTYCPECSNLLVSRSGFTARIEGIEDKNCSNCGRKVDIVL